MIIRFDIYKHNPWRAPGSAPVLDACGLAGGTPWGGDVAEWGGFDCFEHGGDENEWGGFGPFGDSDNEKDGVFLSADLPGELPGVEMCLSGVGFILLIMAMI